MALMSSRMYPGYKDLPEYEGHVHHNGHTHRTPIIQNRHTHTDGLAQRVIVRERTLCSRRCCILSTLGTLAVLGLALGLGLGLGLKPEPVVEAHEGTCFAGDPFLCKNGGLCIPQGDSYGCTNCWPGWTGEFCDEPDGSCNPTNCQNGHCESAGADGFKCVCMKDYVGTMCETKINRACESSPCANGECVLTKTGFKCACPAGYTGPSCETLIVFNCDSNPCVRGTCMEIENGYRCECPANWYGQTCGLPTDPCIGHSCVVGQGTCLPTVDSYTCACEPGFGGDFCEEITDMCYVHQCVAGQGTCKALATSYSCTCEPGYTGTYCEEAMDGCVGNKCVLTQSTCVVSGTSYLCDCFPGYDGVYCENIAPCAKRDCFRRGTCTVLGPASTDYQCVCMEGYSGIDCQINDCAAKTCSGEGLCYILNGVPTCSCNPGYSGADCETYDPTDPCIGQTCSFRGFCVVVDPRTYVCDCQIGYTGKNCEIVDPCAGITCSGQGTCDPTGTPYTCNCLTGFSGVNCEIWPFPSPCFGITCTFHGTCQVDPATATYGCVCDPGYMGFDCEIEGVPGCDACPATACSATGTCIPGLLCSHTCDCDDGYTGSECQYQTCTPCLNVGCNGKGTCVPYGCHFDCVCDPGSYGHYCGVGNICTDPEEGDKRDGDFDDSILYAGKPITDMQFQVERDKGQVALTAIRVKYGDTWTDWRGEYKENDNKRTDYSLNLAPGELIKSIEFVWGDSDVVDDGITQISVTTTDATYGPFGGPPKKDATTVTHPDGPGINLLYITGTEDKGLRGLGTTWACS